MEWLIANWVDITAIIGGVVMVASIVAKLTPTEVDDNILGQIIILLDKLALNNKPTIKK
jgi:hypothetical protein